MQVKGVDLHILHSTTFRMWSYLSESTELLAQFTKIGKLKVTLLKMQKDCSGC